VKSAAEAVVAPPLVVVVVLVEVVAAVGLPAADSQDSTEAANSNTEVAVADMEDACPEGHAICSNHSRSPTTSRRPAESKPIDNNCRTNSLLPRTPA
jgi:hypothetical protein